MDSFNKIISFVLGLVVVLVFFAVITGRINFKNNSVKIPEIKEEACEYYKNSSIILLPVRCLSYYLNK